MDPIIGAPSGKRGLGYKYDEREEFGPYSIEDVRLAFKEFDLDGNSFVGANEMRKIFKYLEEEVDDDVLDEMIRMCDQDGDGQIDMDEFAKMVFRVTGPPILEEGIQGRKVDDEKTKVKFLTNQERADRLFVLKNLLRQIEIQKKDMSKIQDNFRFVSPEGLLNYEKFCQCLEEKEGEVVEALFNMFDPLENGECDWREVFISIANIVATNLDQRINFAFEIFDVDNSGEIDLNELQKILKATHMAPLIEHITKKADAIMRQGDSDKSGELSKDEFWKIAQRFPNLIFPNYGKK